LHTTHYDDGDNGKYFYFSEEEFKEMTGEEIKSTKKFEVVQKGSRFWSGIVRVWPGTSSNQGAHGRREDTAEEGQWSTGDTIQLKSCVDNKGGLGCGNLVHKHACDGGTSKITVSTNVEECLTECEKAGNESETKGCCEWQIDWKKCIWAAGASVKTGDILRSAVSCFD